MGSEALHHLEKRKGRAFAIYFVRGPPPLPLPSHSTPSRTLAFCIIRSWGSTETDSRYTQKAHMT